MLGIKGLAWGSVIQPVIMPKPDLIPLTGGYRRIPVMQIGADVYCDSQVILAEIERRHPSPPVVRGADWAVNLWADRTWFQATVTAVIFGELGDSVPKDFIADREKLSGRPFDTGAMKAAAPFMRAQWRAYAAWIEEGLADGDFLGGKTPSLSDVAAWMNVWWLSGAAPKVADELLAGLERTKAWRDRIRAIGHGKRHEMSPAEALKTAHAGEPAEDIACDDDDPSGLKRGDPVVVQADDYGRDPVEGVLVGADPDRASRSPASAASSTWCMCISRAPATCWRAARRMREMNDRVRIEITDGVADVRLVRADKMNALDDAMFDGPDRDRRAAEERGGRARGRAVGRGPGVLRRPRHLATSPRWPRASARAGRAAPAGRWSRATARPAARTGRSTR